MKFMSNVTLTFQFFIQQIYEILKYSKITETKFIILKVQGPNRYKPKNPWTIFVI